MVPLIDRTKGGMKGPRKMDGENECGNTEQVLGS